MLSSNRDYHQTDHTPLTVDLDEVKSLLEALTGIKFNDPHLEGTPLRFAMMLQALTSGGLFKFTTFDNTERIDEMITVGPVPVYSLCAHHVIPFFGHAWVSYIPDKQVAGLSKLARTVQYYQRGLWVQEHLTQTIADFLNVQLKPLGVGVVIEARHLCMEMRGCEVSGSSTTTSALRGVYKDNTNQARSEFLSYVRNSCVV